MEEVHTSKSGKQAIIHKSVDFGGQDTFLVCWIRGRNCYRIDYFASYEEAINYIELT